MAALLGLENPSIIELVIPRPSTPGAEKDITLINVIALHDIFPNLFFFD
jgi:hypothetical protein